MTLPAGNRTVPALEHITSDAALERLSREWDELLADSMAPTIFLTWAWVDAWRSTLGEGHKLEIVAAREPASGRLLGIAPFAIETRDDPQRPMYRALTFVGSGPAAPDHLDLVVRRGHTSVVGPALWAAASRHADVDVHDFDGVRADSQLAAAALRRSDDLARYTKPTACAFIGLPKTWKAYEESLGCHHRHNLRRHTRKLERDAGAKASFHLVTASEDAEATIEALAHLHRQDGSLFRDAGDLRSPGLVDFHRQVVLRFLDSGRLRLRRLDVADEPAAIAYCFRYGNTVSLYQAGYDPSFARYGPCRHLIAHTITASIDEGAVEFDLLRGDEEHKSRWGGQVRHDLRILKPASAKGRMLLGLRAALRPLRQAGRRLHVPIRRSA